MMSRTTVGRAYPIKQLGEVAEFLDSMRRPVKESERDSGPYPYFGANGQQGTIDGYLFDEPLLLLAEDGGFFDQPHRGIAYRISGKTWVNNHAHVLRPKGGVDLGFLCRILENYDVTPFITGTTRAKLTKAGASEIPIPLPPLPEQRRIAEVLDRAEALRTKRRAALAKLDTLTQAVFLDLFGRPEGGNRKFSSASLDQFCSFFSGFAWRAERFSNDPIGLPLIRIQNVDAVRDAELVFWPDNYEPRFVIHRGDLLLTLSGSFRIAEWIGPNALLNQRIVRVDPKPTVERLWLLHAIRLLVEHIEALGRHALVNNVALSDLKQLRLVQPPIELQREFVRRLMVVEKLKAAHQISLAKFDALFASLQHRAFRGEL